MCSSRIVWIAAMVLATCGVNLLAEPDGRIQPGILPVAQEQTPQAVVEAFLEAWNSQDFETMYGLISPQSRDLYPLPVFQARYEQAHDTLNFTGVSYTLQQATIQGTSTALGYDVSVESAIFDPITDSGRTIRLVLSPEGWRIAWSTLDIFDTMAGEARLRIDSRFRPRASIFDRDGEVLVEDSGGMTILYAVQQDMLNEDQCIDLLAEVLRRSRTSLVRQFANYAPETQFFVGVMDTELYEQYQIDLENTCRIFDDGSGFSKLLQTRTRRYFGQGAAAHVTGYIGRVPADQQELWATRGYQPSDIVGLQGIEFEYEAQLAGRAERELVVAEPGGTILRRLADTGGSDPEPVTLTIDRDLQLITAQAISDAYNYAAGNWGGLALGTGAVVLDVDTGAVLALASYPTYDPGLFNPETVYPDAVERIQTLNDDGRRVFSNKAVQEQYPPGSVFKIVTTTAAAAENIVARDEIFHCDLTWDGTSYGDNLPSRTDWKVIDELPATGDITIAQALTASCDPFFYQMGAELFLKDANLLVSYAERLGLGQPTGLTDIGPEASGNLIPPRNVTEAINNAIGQGDVVVSPIQMARLVAAVANGGTLYRPYIVERVGGVGGAPTSFQAEPEVVGALDLPTEVLDIVREGMCAVTTDTDLGTAYFVFDNTPYTVCGKTGTAQTAGNPDAWFVAYAPAENPQIAIAVLTANSREGSEVSAPIIRRILDDYFDAPRKAFPEWWNNLEYIPLEIPEGATGGG